MSSKLYFDLLEVIEKQGELICELNKKICEVVNENVEKENYIKELSKDVF